MTFRAPGPRATRGALLAAGALLCALGLWQNRWFFHDDAYISLRYAQSWRTRGEISWNPGERVEGYTNFLQVAAVAALAAAGVDPVEAARGVNAVALAALALGFAACARRLLAGAGPGAAPARALGLAALVASWPLLTWVWGGLEAPLFAALVFAGVACAVRALEPGRRGGWAAAAGLWLGVGALARPDGAIFAGVAAAGLAAMAEAPRAERLRRAALLAACFAAPVVPHLLWRHAYYGDWLPNTFYAKATGLLHTRLDWGALYVFGFALMPPFWGILGIAAAVRALRGRQARAARLLAASCAVYAAAIVFLGGDHMPGFRLFVPLVPLLALLLALAAAPLLATPRRCALALAGFALVFGLQAFWPGGERLDRAAAVGTLVGTYIHAHWPAGSTVALNTAGSTPYVNPDLRFIDMLGLNDRVIAHRSVDVARLPYQHAPGHGKGDGAYVLAREPDYVILGPAHGSGVEDPWFLSDLELAESPEFARCYARHSAVLRVGPDLARRADFDGPRLTFTWYERRCPRRRRGAVP